MTNRAFFLLPDEAALTLNLHDDTSAMSHLSDEASFDVGESGKTSAWIAEIDELRARRAWLDDLCATEGDACFFSAMGELAAGRLAG